MPTVWRFRQLRQKKKVGNFANGGAEWEPAGRPVRMNDHDHDRGRADPALVEGSRQVRLPRATALLIAADAAKTGAESCQLRESARAAELQVLCQKMPRVPEGSVQGGSRTRRIPLPPACVSCSMGHRPVMPPPQPPVNHDATAGRRGRSRCRSAREGTPMWTECSAYDMMGWPAMAFCHPRQI
jgi:hypothetical protein